MASKLDVMIPISLALQQAHMLEHAMQLLSKDHLPDMPLV